MSLEPTTTAAIGLAVVVVLEKVYSIFTAGQKFDKRIDERIQASQAAEEKIRAAKGDVFELRIQHLTEALERIEKAMDAISRKLEESVATKQDILQLDARMDALEESNRAHYDSFRRVDRELSQVREKCGANHRRSSESSAFPVERVR